MAGCQAFPVYRGKSSTHTGDCIDCQIVSPESCKCPCFSMLYSGSITLYHHHHPPPTTHHPPPATTPPRHHTTTPPHHLHLHHHHHHPAAAASSSSWSSSSSFFLFFGWNPLSRGWFHLRSARFALDTEGKILEWTPKMENLGRAD